MPIDLNVARRRRNVMTASRAAARYLEVELRHIALQRDGRQVLRDVQWHIRPGERWLLRGANGAGKTQLLKLLAGDVWPQPAPGAQRLYTRDGEEYNEPWLVREEIAYLGAERQDRYEHYHWNHRAVTVVGTGLQHSDIPREPLTRAARTQAQALLRSVGLGALAARRFLTLSYGERRLVLLARALAWRPRLLLLDEPLNGLDATHRQRFLRVLHGLRHSQLPVVYATHRLEEVPAGMSHVAQLAGGRLRTGVWRPKRRRSIVAPRATAHARVTTAASRLLRMRDASVWRDGRAVLRGVSLELARGERVVVHGANGSGKSTLLGTLYGEHAVANGGELWRRGVPPGMPLHAFQRRVGRVSPELQLALPRQLTAAETVVAGLRGSFGLDAPVTGAEQRRARQALRRVGAVALAARAFGTLSYGQARRVLFARALAGAPWLLLLDEPYTGLDSATRSALRALLHSSSLARLAIVMATHHADDWPPGVTQQLELAGGVVRYRGRARRAAGSRR